MKIATRKKKSLEATVEGFILGATSLIKIVSEHSGNNTNREGPVY